MTPGARTETLADARLYLVSPPHLVAGSLAELVPDLAAAGVDVIQLRAKDLEGGAMIAAAEPVAAACRAAGIVFIVNDRPDVALAVDADGVHLGRGDVPVDVARRILGSAIVGRSDHSVADIEAALAEGADYLAVGPVFPTPTKPGRAAVGTELIAAAAELIPPAVPWFAIGGIDAGNVDRVVEAGATRVVVVRAITEAADPPAAARALRAHLA